ncbi:hypothetical protein GTB64_004539 [Salmonella enterica]|nr:hypothetical protein [Salmonella enterica]
MTLQNQYRALKIGACFVVVFVAVHLMGFQERSWPLITAMVLMIPAQDHHHLFRRAGERCAGTLLGALIGVVALQVEKDLSFSAMLPLCFLGAVFAAYYSRSKYPYAAVIVAVTMAVVVNAPAGDLHIAMLRVAGVLIGIVISSAMGWALRL